jgi:DNA repair exonuclease SbcCD ATPase subunit
MARKKPIDELSADELYELARQREREELEAEREANRARLDELREHRREVIAQHRKELASIDREIRQLGGRTRTARAGGGGGEGKISQRVLSLIEASGRISTKDLKASLDAAGVETKNLNQLLAYLKRNGRVVSPSRGVYALPK